MQKSLPARPSLEQFKKQAKELVKLHRNKDSSALALIREFLPSLAGKTDQEIVLFPFALHDAQSVIARQYGFPSWNQLRDHLEGLHPPRLAPEASVAEKFQIICRGRAEKNYDLYCSVMDEAMRAVVSLENFAPGAKVAAYFEPGHTAAYMGEMMLADHTIHFWRLSAPGQRSDLMARMGIKDDLVTGLLFSSPWDTAMGRSKEASASSQERLKD